MKISVENLKCLHEWDQKKIEFALQGANRLIQSKQFCDFWLQAKLTETTPEGYERPLTNQEVLNRILGGDQLNPLDKLNELDVKIVLYRKQYSKVVGYTFTNSLTIYMNRKFFSTPKYIASNLLHEACHQLGFLHGGIWATSVPYTANLAIESLWDAQCQDIDKAYLEWWNS